MHLVRLSQAPHYSFRNGGSTAESRQYWGRRTQYTPNGPRISQVMAGAAPGELRKIYEASNQALSVCSPDKYALYTIHDWNPHAAWDPVSQRLYMGGKRLMYKLMCYDDTIGDWVQMPMPTPMNRTGGTGHWYGMTAGIGDGKVIFKDHVFDTTTAEWTQIVHPWNTVSAVGTWADAGDVALRLTSNSTRIFDKATGAVTLLTGHGHGGHPIAAYHAQHDRLLMVGGTDTARRATLLTRAGAAVQVADVPDDIAMSTGSWVVPHPAGGWLVKSMGVKHLYAAWPNASLDGVTWQDLGVSFDAALTYPTVAVDAERDMLLVVASQGLHGWKLPVLTAP
jgi:hypothetical protein